MDGDVSTETKTSEEEPARLDGWQTFILRATTIITLLIKIFGIGIAAHEAFLTKGPHDPVAFGLAAFMMAGATGLDNVVGNLLGGGKK